MSIRIRASDSRLTAMWKWAKLWFPESDETLWVDLTQVEYEPVVAHQTPPSQLA